MKTKDESDRKSGMMCATDRDKAASWNGSRERMTELRKQYDKAKETEPAKRGAS